MSEELTFEILDEAIKQLPPITYPKQIRVSYRDYRLFREACDFCGIFPVESKSPLGTLAGTFILPDAEVPDDFYEIDF